MDKAEMDRIIIRETTEERERQDLEYLEGMIKHARCLLLPSPDNLNTVLNQGSDETGTLKDFKNILNWAKESELLNEEFFQFYSADQQLDKSSFNGLLNFNFNSGLAAMRNTHKATANELLFYYYAGHGLDQENASKLLISAAPVLEFRERCFKDALPYLRKNRKVKGGELCLHNFGFCDLEGLLEPFIAAIKSPSMNSNNENNEKKNKHLVMVLDSCHSGQFAEDLAKFVVEKQGQDWLNEGCSVTVQASCRKDEKAIGGYFTPTFLYLNDPKNKNVFDKLKGDWSEMKEEEKAKYKDLPFSSPVVHTTRNTTDSPTLEIEVQNVQMTLFQDPGFFKYYHCEIFGPLELEGTSNLGTSRVLNQSSASTFLTNKKFIVRDFKLKTMSTTSFKGEKMGLFLLEDPDNNPHLAICAHVHFAEGGTSKVGRINLVHHQYTPNSVLLLDYEKEDKNGLSKNQVKKGKYKIPVAMVPSCSNANENDPNHWVAWRWKRNPGQSFNALAMAELSGFNVINQKEVECAMELVTNCHDFVECKCPGWWSDPSKWNQIPKDPSYLKLFRSKQRSVSMAKYLEQIENYDLPKVQ